MWISGEILHGLPATPIKPNKLNVSQGPEHFRNVWRAKSPNSCCNLQFRVVCSTALFNNQPHSCLSTSEVIAILFTLSFYVNETCVIFTRVSTICLAQLTLCCFLTPYGASMPKLLLAYSQVVYRQLHNSLTLFKSTFSLISETIHCTVHLLQLKQCTVYIGK